MQAGKYLDSSFSPDKLATSCCRQVALYLPPQSLHQRQNPRRYVICDSLILSKIYDSFQSRCSRRQRWQSGFEGRRVKRSGLKAVHWRWEVRA